jgi:hypothetical protein
MREAPVWGARCENRLTEGRDFESVAFDAKGKG